MFLYPFDTVATRIKANKSEFTGFTQEIKYIMKNETFRSFYRGFTSTFPCSFISNLVYFLLYENMNKWGKSYFTSIEDDRPYLNKLKYGIPLITGPLAELISLMIYLPFDIVRTRLQVNLAQYEYAGMNDGIQKIIKNEGLLRLYMASHLYLLNTCLYTGLQMWFYELTRALLLKNVRRQNSRKLEFYESISTSFLVSVVATTLINPLDVIFTRYQIIDSQKENLSTMGVIKDLIKNEGFKGFAKGLGAKIVGNASLGVIWLPLYDYFKSLYGIEVFD